MINGKTVLAVIPARGGSKGIPKKNIKLIAGKPLIAWTINEAKKSNYIDKLILSSDDEEIIEIAKEYGCEVPFMRPSSIAQDDTPGIEPILHALDNLRGYDYVVQLQPTSPLRQVEDIDGCIEKCVINKANACVTLTEAKHNPYWMYHISNDDKLKSFVEQKQLILRRQDLPVVYALNGAVYVAESKFINEARTFITTDTIAYIMPEERSLDIDTGFDLIVFEQLIKGDFHEY